MFPNSFSKNLFTSLFIKKHTFISWVVWNKAYHLVSRGDYKLKEDEREKDWEILHLSEVYSFKEHSSYRMGKKSQMIKK